jgi:hypothetical protein
LEVFIFLIVENCDFLPKGLANQGLLPPSSPDDVSIDGLIN